MWAVSIAKLTVARTPDNLFKDFSIEFTQEEQVMPLIVRSTCLVSNLESTARFSMFLDAFMMPKGYCKI
jgi:hypothetical protein